jgi:hypothetical protein
MRRGLLLSVSALGAALALGSVTGVIAAFTDQATTGSNSVTSAALPKAVNLEIAPRTSSDACTTWTDNTATPVYTLANLTASPDTKFAGAAYCLRNTGAVSASVVVKAFDVVDSELDCTGDEADAGDATCGGDGTGELSPLVELQVMKFGTCPSGGSGTAFSPRTIAAMAESPSALTTLAPGDCAYVSGLYRYNPSQIDGMKAQSDQVTFRLAFLATSV